MDKWIHLICIFFVLLSMSVHLAKLCDKHLNNTANIYKLKTVTTGNSAINVK